MRCPLAAIEPPPARDLYRLDWAQWITITPE